MVLGTGDQILTVLNFGFYEGNLGLITVQNYARSVEVVGMMFCTNLLETLC